MASRYYQDLLKRFSEGKKSLAILIDPDKFSLLKAEKFIERIPDETTHFFVGGSIITNGNTRDTVHSLKSISKLPVFLFPGDYTQIAPDADALLFLSLLSGRNAEYLVGQHVKSISTLKDSNLEIIPTGYLLLDGGNKSSVERVTKTPPMAQNDLITIVNTALAGQYMGAKLIYLEAGSGAKTPVNTTIIKRVKEAIDVPLIVGGGIKTEVQKNAAYEAGADLIVMGTVFENDTLYT
jgi:phosphoglycerol geranylgeranyltransferase